MKTLRVLFIMALAEPMVSGLLSRTRDRTLLPQGARPRDPALSGEQVGIVVVASAGTYDEDAPYDFQGTYAQTLRSLESYARARGYEFWLLNGEEFRACDRHRAFFYKKHCVVSEFLATRGSRYAALVLDADVVAAVLSRGLDKWLDSGGDLQLYERCTGSEIAAGNYIARNRPWVRRFLSSWADFEGRQPLGFSSADNGALHVHLLEFLQLEGAGRCGAKYKDLRDGVNNLTSYLDFIGCAKAALGPPRSWSVGGVRGESGVLTVWPRLQFLVADGVYLNLLASNDVGPVMHHGIKNGSVVRSHYFSNLQTCSTRDEDAKIPAEELEAMALMLARGYPQLYEQGSGCKQCVEVCVGNFSCSPLSENDDPKPRRS